jgi:hypothetical protein
LGMDSSNVSTHFLISSSVKASLHS